LATFEFDFPIRLKADVFTVHGPGPPVKKVIKTYWRKDNRYERDRRRRSLCGRAENGGDVVT
jgi:hypothetical protein